MPTNNSDRLYERDDPVTGQVTLSDGSEVTLFDKGSNGGNPAFRVHSILNNLTLGSHANITVRVKASVNGSLQTIDSNQYSSGQVTDSLGDISPDRVTSPRVVITAQGSNSSPSTNGTVDHTIEYTRAN